ncbi:RHS repeat domain-containing protein [Clostridium grantii]|uniref:RHS repeat-associated core domain-containing protein n=1 Tax=Clostridium grantii DSM 8605 TaxID=1121316 RepID=A0A1M5Y6L3_9CLOT|nr:RHS repeat-associated core domain-containing protein [Clostridium grantii]SHI07731.1 RHS repeat-associated core domain-containing protein [Clostridium grantii DSM 8605]
MNGNGQSISYKYNASGIRTQKTVNGVTTKYHLEGDKVTYETSGSDKIHYTYDSNGKLVSMNLNGKEYYYIRNAQGDITGLFDKNGATVVEYTYDSWGKLISISGSLASGVGVKNPYRYRGYRYDTGTGLYYLQSRYYNPQWGRFVNMDSVGGKVGVLLSHNVFAYSNNNPINMVDPSGHFAFALSFVAEAVMAVGATVGAVLSSPVVLVGAAIAATCFLGYAIYTHYTSTPDSSSEKISSSKGMDGAGGGSSNTPNNNDNKEPKGFKSFRKLKKFVGPAGAGKAWHHIVEQTPANIAKFGEETIHNIDNIMKLDHGKGSMHAQISGFYSSIKPFTNGLRVRTWLSTKSFEEQYEFGMKIIKLFQDK